MTTPLNLHDILIRYEKAMGNIIVFLSKKFPDDPNMAKVKNLYTIAKSNETVFFEKTSPTVWIYRDKIASGKKEDIMEIDPTNEVNALCEEDKIPLVNSVIKQLKTLLQTMNNTEWTKVSEHLKELVRQTSKHALLKKIS
jgi:hypothetical protein